jgi:hypothetical protein
MKSEQHFKKLLPPESIGNAITSNDRAEPMPLNGCRATDLLVLFFGRRVVVFGIAPAFGHIQVR